MIYFMQSIQIADEMSHPVVQNEERWGLAQAYLFQNDLVNAHATIEAALKYNWPQNDHNVTALHGIISLRQGDKSSAHHAFMQAIAQADELLTNTPNYFTALDAKGLALCGMAICRGSSQTVHTELEQAVQTFRLARKIASHAGVVRNILRLFDELAKCDQDRILKDIRQAVEGKE